MNVWVCVVRKEAFVGGESQRCRHPRCNSECGEMELIGGEPVEWCVVHQSPVGPLEDCWDARYDGTTGNCQFESQIRVGP